MKLKYYLRGLGIGICVTTIILMINFAGKKDDISNEEIMARATQLGMVMPTEDTETATETEETQETETENKSEAETEADTQKPETEQPATEQPATEQSASSAAGNESGSQQSGQEPNPAYMLTVNQGDVCRTVCENLAANGVVDDAEGFRDYLFQIGYASSISVGNYQIPYNLTYEQIAQILQSGPMKQ